MHASSLGELVRAMRTADGMPVLMRVLSAQHRPEQLEQFKNEYQIVRALNLPTAVRPVAFERHEGRPALVLEDSGEESLEQALGTPLSVERFLRLAIAIVEALEKIHQQEVVHRDLRPANIMIHPATGRVRITGFGIAAALPLQKEPAGSARVLEGSLPYMSPEQTGRMNRPCDERSDLYALGVTFYQMLTGRLPFLADDPVEWVHCHVARSARPVDELAPGVPAPVSACVMKLLAKAPEARYQSARGLRRDLESCLAAWTGRGAIEPFVLGLADQPQRWQFPQRLYGRERESAALLAAFQRVAETGAPELVLVAGTSGIGKSSLVNELQAPLVRARGWFATGRFSPQEPDRPYRAFVQAVSGLVQEILGENDEGIGRWRRRLLGALGSNGQLVAELIPSVEIVIGPQPPVPAMPPAEAQKRFRLVLARFVAAFASQAQPLVLFLDDLQWADPASLALLPELLSLPEASHLLLVGAYRDNEVGETHPLGATLRELPREGSKGTTLTLGPLPEEQLTALVADALQRPLPEVVGLAGLLGEKTGGNPFFVHQFLSMLEGERLVHFDDATRGWRWDLAAIRAKGLTDNVGELMAGRLRRLTGGGLRVLQTLACLAASASRQTLGRLVAEPEHEVDEALAAAVRAGLLLRTGGAYRFSHDRVQEAAYALVPPEQRAALHLALGRSLLASTSAEELPERLFAIVTQLNKGSSAITGDADRVELARLNLLAGERSKAASAYAAAAAYFAAGLAALPSEAAQGASELTLALLAGRAESAYATADFQLADQLCETLLARAPSVLARARAHALHIAVHASLADFPRAIAGGLQCLASLGIDLTAGHGPGDLPAAEARFWQLLGETKIEDLLARPAMSDAGMQVAMEVLSAMAPPTFFADQNLHYHIACVMACLSLEHGHAPASPVGYALFGCVTSHLFGRYQQADRLARLACALVDRPVSLAHRPFAYLMSGLITAYTDTPAASTAILDRGFDAALENGDLTFAAYVSVYRTTNVAMSGEPLDGVLRRVQADLAVCRKSPNPLMADGLLGVHQLVQMLRGHTSRFGSFDDREFDTEAFERKLRGPGFSPHSWAHYQISKLRGFFMAGDHLAARQAADEIAQSGWMTLSQPLFVEYSAYAALTLAAIGPAAADWPAARDRVRAHQNDLRRWAAGCPGNFFALFALVSAEVARLEQHDAEAMSLYDQAIGSAAENGYVQNEALASELAARFYRERGAARAAETYLHQARDGYARWGAHGKVAQLDQGQAPRAGTTPPSSAPLRLPADRLDVMSVFKASQAISGEILLDRLLRKLLQVVLEQAGAQRGYLILRQGEELAIEAEAVAAAAGSVSVELLRSLPVASSSLLSPAIVQYVARTGQRLLLDDAALAPAFASDPYLTRTRPRSVLCLPILWQAEVGALLYLENNLLAGAFTADRLQALELLASQAAMAIDNARLHRQTLEALRLREDFLTVASHELRTPLATLTLSVHALTAETERPLAPDDHRSVARNIGRQVKRLNHLVGELLDVSTMDQQAGFAPELGPVDLGALAREVVERLAPDLQRARCPVTIQAEPGVVGCWDRSRLDRVIVNLLSNAMKFGADRPIEVNISQVDRSTARLIVKDHGIGIPADYHSRIFERFGRAVSARHYGGLGLGLYICRRIVEAHGGSITVTSKPGTGATFCIDLPLPAG